MCLCLSALPSSVDHVFCRTCVAWKLNLLWRWRGVRRKGCWNWFSAASCHHRQFYEALILGKRDERVKIVLTYWIVLVEFDVHCTWIILVASSHHFEFFSSPISRLSAIIAPFTAWLVEPLVVEPDNKFMLNLSYASSTSGCKTLELQWCSVFYACFSIIVKKMLPISVDQGADYAVTDSMENIELIDNILGEFE